MKALEGRVAIITGAARGLGKSHALHFSKLGACVVVNDVGCALNGEGRDTSEALSVVEQIHDSGGEAVVSSHDVSNWREAEDLVKLAVDTFGGLDVLVNNAGILRDRAFANMSEQEWDAVINVHLKGHAATSHHALHYWRSQAKSGSLPNAAIIHTTSVAGLYPNFGQANYCAAKMGIVALSQVIAMEGARYGVRSNAVAPSAQTRLTEEMGMDVESMGYAPGQLDPAHVSRLVAWLAKGDCPATGQVFHVLGKRITLFDVVSSTHTFNSDSEWEINDLDTSVIDHLVEPKSPLELISPGSS